MHHWWDNTTVYVCLLATIAVFTMLISLITQLEWEKRPLRRAAGFFGVTAVSVSVATSINASTGHQMLVGVVVAVIGAVLWASVPELWHYLNRQPGELTQ